MPRGRERPGVAKRLSLAEILLARGESSACADQVRSILAEDSTHVGAMELLAKALWQTCEFEHLLPLIDRLIVLNPYEPGYHSLRGLALQALGRYGEAARALARAPESANALANLQDWQAGIIASLIQEDAVFRAAYAQDP